MSLRESTFNTKEIQEFLFNTGNTFAASCWHNDMVNNETVTHTKASKWFKNYFPSNKNQYLFRLMETQVTQVMLTK